MSLYKKLGIGLGLFVAICITYTATIPFHKVAAYTENVKDVTDCINSLEFNNIADIVCNTSTKEITFHDSDPTDDNGNYAFPAADPVNDMFCDPGDITPPGSFSSSFSQGITIKAGNSVILSKKLMLYDAGQPVNVKLNIGYKHGTGCLRYGDPESGADITIPANKTAGIKYLLRFQDENIVSLEGIDDGSSIANKSYAFVGKSFFASDDYTKCQGELLKVTVSGGKASGLSYILMKDSRGVDPNNYPDVSKFFLDPGQNVVGCGVQKPTNFGVGHDPHGPDDYFGIFGSAPDDFGNDKPTNPPILGNGSTSSADSCEASGGGWSLTWLACPIFSFGSGLADSLIKTFEDQASFTMGQLTSNNGQQSLHDAWTAIRNVASAFLVIIMLVAVISQAVSFGPFDAYTIRKILPRIVVAIILMQLSWILVSTIVDLVNTVGNGVKDLLYAPFNNSGQLDKLGALFHNAGFGTAEARTFNWLAIVATLGLAVAALPTLIMGIFAAVVALAIGLAALIFRKILIMMLVLFAPIAFLLWILPGAGTQKYYKLWSDNLIKALMMYPLIVLLIAGGRVFAWVAGGTGGIIAFFTVMIGFFGPLFVLPKTYKWGGSIMSAAGGAISTGITKAAKPASDYLGWRKDISRWSMARKNRKAILEQRASRDFARGLQGSPDDGRLARIRTGARRARLVGASTHEGDVLRRAGRLASAQVAKAKKEDIEGYSMAIGDEIGGMEYGSALDHLSKKFDASKSEEERTALLKTMAQYQSPKTIEKARTKVEKEGGDWSTYANSGYLFSDLRKLDPSLNSSTAEKGESFFESPKHPEGHEQAGEYVGPHTLRPNDQILSGMTKEGWDNLIAEAEKKDQLPAVIAAFDRASGLPGNTITPETRANIEAIRTPAESGGGTPTTTSGGAAAGTPAAEGPLPSGTYGDDELALHTPEELHANIEGRGGYGNLHDDDVVRLHEHGSGVAQTRATEEYDRRTTPPPPPPTPQAR